ncbi:unnamed protein product [Symbiodinium pilosum]|uniref:Uncharacterized protein n=1 Tax=Symbiodinium pilosum TaxID=2952 RepID=A0A812U049_SYMPI|nr:unnamed protein product [Symbiodinium pilosum]
MQDEAWVESLTLEEQGIMGLAAFLERSDELTVLWSPRYFTRLWLLCGAWKGCIYEISTFLRKKDNRAQIQVMPVKLALLLCISVTKWFVMVAVWHTVSRVSDPDEELEALSRTLAVTVPCVLCAAMVPYTYYVGIGMMEACLASFQCLNARVVQKRCFFLFRPGAGFNVNEHPVEMRALVKHS